MNVPKIRFKGYDREWDKDTIGNVSTSFSGGTPTAGNISFYGGNIPFIRSGEIHSDNTELSLTEQGLNSSSAKIVAKGSILYALYGATSGEVDISKVEGAINQAILAIFPKEDINKYFLCYLLQGKKEHIVNTLIQGGQGNLSGELIKNYFVAYPNICEQQQIAQYFKSLDSLIEATGKKITSLKQTKQACMQQMFPAEGETTPRVRFKGFEGVWQLRKIGELGTTYSGLSGKSKVDFGLGSARYITFLNVLTNAHIDTTIFESVNIKPGEKQNKVVKGDILFNTSSETPEEVGYCSVLMNDIDNLYLNSFCFGFRPYAGTINPEFMVYLMRGQIGRSIMKILAQGATRYNLSKNRLCEVTIPIPANDDEQQQIAAFFSNMDKQIRIQEQRLEKLKRIKTACLENMFV